MSAMGQGPDDAFMSRGAAFSAGAAGAQPNDEAPGTGIGPWGRSMIGSNLYGHSSELPGPPAPAPGNLAAAGSGFTPPKINPPTAPQPPPVSSFDQIRQSSIDASKAFVADRGASRQQRNAQMDHEASIGPNVPPLNGRQRAMDFLKGAPSNPGVLGAAHVMTANSEALSSLNKSPSLGGVFNYAMGYHLHPLTTPFGRHMVLKGQAEDAPRPSLLKARGVRRGA